MSSEDDVHEAFAKIRELNEGVRDGLRAMEVWLRRARGASTLSAEGLQAIGMALRVHQRPRSERRLIHPRNLRRDFKAILEAAQPPEIRFHDLRHTAGTLLALQGVHHRTIMGTLGHSQLSTTEAYVHVADADEGRRGQADAGTARCAERLVGGDPSDQPVDQLHVQTRWKRWTTDPRKIRVTRGVLLVRGRGRQPWKAAVRIPNPGVARSSRAGGIDLSTTYAPHCPCAQSAQKASRPIHPNEARERPRSPRRGAAVLKLNRGFLGLMGRY